MARLGRRAPQPLPRRSEWVGYTTGCPGHAGCVGGWQVTSERSLITDDLRAAVNVPAAPRSFVVDRTVAARLAEALGEDPAAVTAAPHAPLYYVSAFETQMHEPALPSGIGPGVLAGDDWELRRPLRWGERLSCIGRVADVYERFGGQHGQTLYTRHEWQFTDGSGALVAVGRRVFARFFPPAPAEEAP